MLAPLSGGTFKFQARQAGFLRHFVDMNATWPLQDAKNKLSELLDTVRRHGAQTITRHGKPVAVVISAEAYARLQPAEKLVDILRDCPVKDWQLERDPAPARDLDLQ
jgi:prevent-host-death family protein